MRYSVVGLLLLHYYSTLYRLPHSTFRMPKGDAVQLGFIGIGNIGTPMCHHLLQAGHTILVYDINFMRQARARGRGGNDLCGLMRLLEEHLGLQVRAPQQ